MTDHIARSIAEFTTTRPPAEQEARWEARRRILDSLSLSIASFADPAVALARSIAEISPAGATVWGTATTYSLADAILANGVATRYRDMNDTYFGAEALHPSDMVPALCAVAEHHGADLETLLDAICVAYDVAVDMADTWRTAPRGFDHVNLIGFGVIAGIARIRRLNTDTVARALGLAATTLVATRETRKGHLSMWKGYAAANQSVGALHAVRLAMAGIVGPPLAFTGKQGFLAVAIEDIDPAAPWTRPAAARHDHRIRDTHLKEYPLGYLAQNTAQLAASLHERIGSADRVRGITIHTYRRALEIMADPQKWRIDSPETADHSLPYVTLAALLDGTVTIETMYERRWSQPDIARLLPNVEVVADEDMTADYPVEMRARVDVALDTETLTAEAAWPRGHSRNPLSDDALMTRSLQLLADEPDAEARLTRVLEAPLTAPAAELWRDWARGR